MGVTENQKEAGVIGTAQSWDDRQKHTTVWAGWGRTLMSTPAKDVGATTVSKGHASHRT